jgi:hypothetical protein
MPLRVSVQPVRVTGRVPAFCNGEPPRDGARGTRLRALTICLRKAVRRKGSRRQGSAETASSPAKVGAEY